MPILQAANDVADRMGRGRPWTFGVPPSNGLSRRSVRRLLRAVVGLQAGGGVVALVTAKTSLSFDEWIFSTAGGAVVGALLGWYGPRIFWSMKRSLLGDSDAHREVPPLPPASGLEEGALGLWQQLPEVQGMGVGELGAAEMEEALADDRSM